MAVSERALPLLPTPFSLLLLPGDRLHLGAQHASSIQNILEKMLFVLLTVVNETTVTLPLRTRELANVLGGASSGALGRVTA